MERSEFNKLLNDINQINENDIQALEDLRIKYPYYQNLHFLLAKAYKARDSEELKPALNRAAIYAVDRAYLKKIFTGEQEFIEVIRAMPSQGPKSNVVKKSDAIEIEAKHSEVSPTEETDKLKKNQVLSELDENLKSYEERKRIMQALLDEKPVEPVKASPPKNRSFEKKSQIELIEKFIKNDPQMGKQELTVDESSIDQTDLADVKLEDSDKFLTETLAKLMVKQKKYNRAVDIYEKLKLKFPKKTAYFASQIEKIKEISNV